MIYFDHNATTPLDERVVAAMLPFFTDYYGNPSSLYRLGRLARSAIDTAREQVAALVGARPEQVIFTSGGTEANNLALRGAMGQWPDGGLAVSSIEHASILETAIQLSSNGHSLHTIAVNGQGLVDDASLHAACTAEVKMASIMLANNETGAIQDVEEASAIFAARNILVHTDAVQAVGKIPVDFKRLGVQLLSLSSHKIYGPKGCGALVKSADVTLAPQLTGGGQEQGWRAGTENVAAIVGFGKAAELAAVELCTQTEMLRSLKQRLEMGLRTIAGMSIFAEQVPRLPNTVQFGIEGHDGEMLLMQLDRKDIAVSSGSACSVGGGEASHVLVAMGVDAMLAKSALRISLGAANTAQQVDDFLAALKAIV